MARETWIDIGDPDVLYWLSVADRHLRNAGGLIEAPPHLEIQSAQDALKRGRERIDFLLAPDQAARARAEDQ